MARQRMLWPSIWDDEDVGALSDGAFRLFIACVSNADDEGKLEASARRLKGIAFRFRDDVSIDNVAAYRSELIDVLRSVVLYEIDGREYIMLNNWLKYQTIRKPQGSKIPNPDKAQCVTQAYPVRTQCVPSDAPVRTDSINELGELEEVIETTESVVMVDDHASSVVAEFKNYFSYEIGVVGCKVHYDNFKRIYKELRYDDLYLSLQLQQAIEVCGKDKPKAGIQPVMNYLRKSTADEIKQRAKQKSESLTEGIGDDLTDQEFERRYGVPRGAIRGTPSLMNHVRAVEARRQAS
jgi:hypothetical protein